MKRNRIIAAVLLLALLTVVFSACGKKADGMNYKETDGGVAISGYTDKTSVTAIRVPDEIDGKPVIRINDFGLCNAESLKTITIGKNVREIGAWALTNNQHLTAYEVDPANECFAAVDGVLFTKDLKTLVSYPCGKGIEFDEYGRAKNAVDYEIPAGVEVIACNAFYKCGHVNVTAFPDSLKRIEEKAFFKCYYREEFSKDNVVESGLKNFTLPEGLEYIGKDAFSYDELLTEVTLPATLREIGDFAFFNCKNMTKLTVKVPENALKQGEKWQPTAKGRIMKDCEVVFAP